MKQNRFATAKEAQATGWFSRSHETREAHDAASGSSKRFRQERALEQRRAQLLEWQNEPAEIADRAGVAPTHENIAAKIATCKAEIRSLEKKIGFVPVVIVEGAPSGEDD